MKSIIKEEEVEKISYDKAKIQEILNDPSSVFVGYSQEGYNLHIWINQGIKYYIEPELNIINKIEIMQQKESKTSWHFWISFAKSIIRLFAAFALIGQSFTTAGLSFILAEILGIAEEF